MVVRKFYIGLLAQHASGRLTVSQGINRRANYDQHLVNIHKFMPLDTVSACSAAVEMRDCHGAANGIGAATARLLSEQGWPLLLCDLNMEKKRRSRMEGAPRP
jgi:hypothetical protein